MLRLCITLVLSGLIAASAMAQARHFQYVIVGGVAYPLSDKGFTDVWDTGLHLGLGLGYSLSPSMTLIGTAEVSNFPLDDEAFLLRNGFPLADNRAEEGSATIVTAALSLKYSLARSRSGEALFFTAGANFSRFNEGDVLQTIVVDNVSHATVLRGHGQTAFGINAGTGFNVHLSSKSYLFIEARYTLLFLDKPSVQFVPLRMGVAFR
ncbi:MAG: outer membrane beta-barrel protein [Candidatus Zixiibacteriota bacterium]